MENKKGYRFLVNLDPQNPMDKRCIDTIDQIRKLYKINKRQVINRLLSLYQYFVNSGVKDPFGISENGVVSENQLKAKQEAIAALAIMQGQEMGKTGEETRHDASAPDIDIPSMDSFDPASLDQGPETVSQGQESEEGGKKMGQDSSEPDFDVQMMENFDSGLFGQQFPD